LNVLVCVKRVPETGARITLTPDAQAIDTTLLGFTISPHEECAVEEALRIVEQHGGSTTVLTLGPASATEQLQNAMAMGIGAGLLLETDDGDWNAEATAAAIADSVRSREFDLLLFGNEAADTGEYQVGVRVAHALGLPCVTGIKGIAFSAGTLTASREAGGGWEIFELPLPAVVTVKEGINLPRYASIQGRLRAKKATIQRVVPEPRASALETVRLVVPPEQEPHVQILESGADAAQVLRDLGLVAL
jgi:electron transfer flavoprotein beta subunit